MTKGELDSRARAGRDADDDRLFDFESTKQCRKCVRLRGRRRIEGNGSAEIAKPRWRDNSKMLTHEVGDVVQSLVIAATRSVDGQERNADAPFRILHPSDACVGSSSTALGSRSAPADFGAVRQINGGDGNNERTCSESEDCRRSAHRKALPRCRDGFRAVPVENALTQLNPIALADQWTVQVPDSESFARNVRFRPEADIMLYFEMRYFVRAAMESTTRTMRAKPHNPMAHIIVPPIME